MRKKKCNLYLKIYVYINIMKRLRLCLCGLEGQDILSYIAVGKRGSEQTKTCSNVPGSQIIFFNHSFALFPVLFERNSFQYVGVLLT